MWWALPPLCLEFPLVSFLPRCPGFLSWLLSAALGSRAKQGEERREKEAKGRTRRPIEMEKREMEREREEWEKKIGGREMEQTNRGTNRNRREISTRDVFLTFSFCVFCVFYRKGAYPPFSIWISYAYPHTWFSTCKSFRKYHILLNVCGIIDLVIKLARVTSLFHSRNRHHSLIFTISLITITISKAALLLHLHYQLVCFTTLSSPHIALLFPFFLLSFILLFWVPALAPTGHQHPAHEQ